MTLLITGFEPFATVKENPSQKIVEYIAAKKPSQIATQILPVDYQTAGEKLFAAIELYQPQAVLLLGVAQKRKHIALERLAININDARIPDNNGNLKTGQPIVENAPVGYWSTLPLEAMYDAIAQTKIPVKYSNHAGAYLCNHVMYVALHHYATRGQADIPCGFVHVPGVEFVPVAQQIKAIEIAITIILETITTLTPHQ